MATGSPNREFSTEELDAMAAAELPVENPETSRTASAPIASAPTAPEATGSPELAVGDGTSFSMQEPPRGPAMGPVAKLEAGREYSTEELDLIEQANKPKEFTSDELDKATVDALNDPKYIPTRDEFFEQKATKERMVAAGKLPGTAEVAANAVGGLFVSAGDAFNMAVAHPFETIARSPATLQTGVGRAAIGALQLGGWAKQALEGDPKYRDEATGEFFTFSDPDFLRQQMEQGKKLRPTNEEDLKDWEFENHIYKKGIDSQYQDLGQKAGPTELLTRVLTGRNQNELPIESQSQVVEMAADPTNLIPFGAGAKALGLSRGMKLVSSQAAGVVEKLSGGLVKGNDVLAERFANVVTNTTGLAPEDLTTMGKALNYGKNVGIGAGIAGGAAAVGAPPEVAAFITGFYPAYKAGLGVLRKIETGAGTTKIIMREAADATNGLDQAARAAVLANNSVPQVFKEVLERPSQFVSIESTPARLAANQSLSPQMRAFMGKLSNPAIVQAVRGTSALAKGAVKGVAINAPFAALAYNAGEDDQAAGMLGAGVAFGAAGAGIDRFTGLQERRQQAAISDVSRMLVDVELNAGDVSKLMSTQTPDNLVKLAAMQGTFRNGLDFVPLNAIDYEKNVSSNGGAGAAGLFLQATPGERARIYINLDAKRQGIEPHEFGHALLASGALDGQQKYAARAWVEKAYGADGIKSRASEYASAIIRAKNSEAFPDGNFEISPGTLASEMDNLTQGGLARGDMDGLDWARDEIFAETFAKASQSMDFSAIRRGAPAGGNVLTFAEGILGAQSRALSASGVRIDPQTGAPLDTPDALFKENPLLATDKNLINQLGTYINNYRQWANDPTHEKPRPNKVAPSGRASDVINNPQVTFYDRGDGVKATTFAVQDPVTGQAVLRDQRDLNAEHKKVREQLKALAGSRLLPDKDPVLGPKKTTDGRVTVRGRVLPQSFDFLNGFMPHIRNFARQFEALGAAGESMQVRYHAIGSGDSGAFQIKKLGNLEAITREVVPWGWELTKAGNLNATVLDLSQFRNRAMRAINDHNPALAVFEWDMGKIEGDLKQWMQNHRDELPGNTKIGDLKRDVLNSLVGVATTENRSRNPLHGSFGPGSAIKQFRLDRVDAAVGTGRQGFHFDYEKAKGNFMPDKPAPMPDLSRDLPTGQAMPDRTSTSGTAPNGNPSNLNSDDHALVRTPEFKAWAGDWEALAEISNIPQSATVEQATNALNVIAGKNLTNLATGIVAQINSKQRSKIISNAALAKSLRNGFSAEAHNAASAKIDTLWKHAELLNEKNDRSGDLNVLTIKRFVSPIILNGDIAVGYLTAKQSAQGHRLYSIELTEIQKLRTKGDMLEVSNATSAAFNEKLRLLTDKVNPKSITIKTDGNGEPSVYEVARFRKEKFGASSAENAIEKGVMQQRPAGSHPQGQAMPDAVAAPPFFLKSAQLIDSKIQGRVATTDQVKAILGNPQSGIKAEELKWTGVMQEVERLAKENNGKVPKEDLLKFFAEDGAVRLEEVTMGGGKKQWTQSDIDRLERNAQRTGDWAAYEQAVLEYEDQQLGSDANSTGNQTKYAQYQLPGGENYREVVLAMPPSPRPDARQIAGKYGYSPNDPLPENVVMEIQQNLDAAAKERDNEYRSSHFDTPNYVAHMRLNERADAEGRPGLFIEELQSDRHQQGREKGYREDSTEFYLENAKGETAGPYATRESADFSNDGTYTVKERPIRSGVPDAPFRTTWPLQLFKRALRDAVASGKDWIGWTTGDTQAARFDLSKQVDSVNVSRGGGETWEIWADKDGQNAVRKDVNSIAEVAEVLGKELAKKVEDMKPGESVRTFSGVDLKVGGEGMKGFYDNMVPKEISKYVKQWGSQVKKVEIEISKGKPTQYADFSDYQKARTDGRATPIWRVDITPQMREGIKKVGQSLFIGTAAATLTEDEE